MMLSRAEWAIVAAIGLVMTLVCSRAAYLLAEGMAAVLVVMQP